MFWKTMFDDSVWGFKSPFAELERMKREMSQLAGSLIKGIPARMVSNGVFPLINLTEDKNNYYIRAEIPGINVKDLDIRASGRSISLTGERKIASEENARYHRRERESGKFSRMINLPGDINTDTVEANLVNGILTLIVPKAEAAKPKQITIK